MFGFKHLFRRINTRSGIGQQPALQVFGTLILLLAVLVIGCGCGRITPTPEAVRLSPPEAVQPTATTPAGLQVSDPGDPLPPQVIARQPAENQEMAPDGSIEITFDQAMDQEATAAALQIIDSAGKMVSGELVWSTERTVQFVPSAPLEAGEMYQVVLNSQAVSLAGLSMAETLEWEFTTAGSLEVVQVFPADETEDVETDVVITVIFNRPVAPLVIAEEQVNLPDPLRITPSVEGHGEWVNTSVYTFQPDQPLAGKTTYTVVVAAGLEDATGDLALAEDYSWTFTTMSPEVVSYWMTSQYWNQNPGYDYVDVRLDEAFGVLFSQPMSQESVEESISIVSSAGEPALLDFTWNEAFTQVIITPTQRLAYDTQYTLAVDSTAEAISGGALSRGLTWRFMTLLTPGVSWTYPADRETQTSFSPEFSIHFRSPMDFNSLKDKIIIEPTPEDVEWSWYYDSWGWSYYTYGLKASTDYTVRILPGMTDIYGTAITSETVVRFRTAAYPASAYLQMPYGTVLYRTEGTQDFYATYRNVSQVEFSLYQLPWDLFTSLIHGTVNAWNYRPTSSLQLWERVVVNTGELNETVTRAFPLSNITNQALEPGFYFLGMDAPEVNNYSAPFDNYRMFMVMQGNLLLKTTDTEALVWLTDLTTGEPMPGVPVSVYLASGVAVAAGTTDEEGLLFLDLGNAPTGYDQEYFALAGDATTPLAFAASRWDSDVNLYNYGIWTDYYSLPRSTVAYVYTERPIYRPGQPVYFKGIVRMDDDLAYSLPDLGSVNVVISSYDEVVYQETLPLSELGSFDAELLLDSEAALGWYTILVQLPGKSDVIGSVGFNVAEYRRPEFQVGVAVDPAQTLPGNEFEGTITAEYYSGGAVSGAEVYWTLAAEPFYFIAPPELSGYSFEDRDLDTGYFYYDYYGMPGPTVIAQGTGTTGADGTLTIRLPAELGDSANGKRLTLEATVTDLSGSSVSNRADVIVHRSAVYAGVRARDYVGKAGEEQTIEVVAVNWDGSPVPGQSVRVEIVERRWYSVQEQNPQGQIIWTSTVENIPVAEFEDVIVDERGRASVTFTPPNGGVYRARVVALDEDGNQASATAYLWVSSSTYIPWRQGNDRGFELIADKELYLPGETAEILIASPFQGDTYALVTTERGHIRSHEVILLTSNSTIYELPISADMAPNLYVFVTIIKGVDESNAAPDFRVGVVQINVEPSAQALNVEIAPDRLTAVPGDEVVYTVRTTTLDGTPVSAEVSLSLSDLATLSLSEPNSQPILDYFYSARSLSVWTAMPMLYSIEHYVPVLSEEEGFAPDRGSGGGKGGDLYGVIEVRQDFPDTAYWEASVQTNEDGEATVTVALPDNLTTWRMEARAATADTRVGQATVDLVSNKPLLVRPQTPRFFVAGDVVIVGAAVHNNTETDLSVDVTLIGEGVDLDGDALQVVEVPAGQQAYITWQITVMPDVERVDLVFSAQGGGYSDASKPTLGSLEGQGIPVYRYEVPETVGTAGQMLEGGTLVEAISLPAEYAVEAGELVIRISPSLAAGMTDGLKYLEHYPYECVEQTVSRFLPNVVSTRALREAGLSDPELEAGLTTQVSIALQRLYNWQNADGGWGWWSRQESSLLTTSYVVLGLVEAREAGYTVSEDVLRDGLRFLSGKVIPVTQNTAPYLMNRQAFVLYVLARADRPNVSRTGQLFDQRLNLAYYSRAYLAWTLHAIDAEDPRVDTLLSDLNNAAILSATGTHWEEDERDYWNWNTDTRSTAIVLSVLSQLDAANPLNANAVRWLMVNRTNGYWYTTQETAWSLMALTNWMVASGELEADYEYGVALNGEQLGGGMATAETLRETQELRIDIVELVNDEANRLAIARDDGPGNLYYTAHLKVYLPVESVKALERGIIVSRTYYAMGDSLVPVTQAQQGDLLLVRLTIVAPTDLHYVVIDDPLPAGFEAVDQSLLTSPQSVDPSDLQWDQLGYQGWGWWYFDHVEMRDEKLVLSANYLPAGTYVYTYLARASTVGTFRVIPPTAQEFYFPEVYGRGDGMLFEVKP